MKVSKPPRLRTINNLLSILAVTLALYLIAMPFLPQARWWAGHLFKTPDLAVVQVTSSRPAPKKTIQPGYWLDIPRISLHQKVYTGQSMSEVNLGVWRIWGTSSPDKGGNTVVAAHRWTYSNPQGIFYNLDKVQINDRVTVDWSGTEYTYIVSNIKTVPPTDIGVYTPSSDSRFTMYTCTPLITAKNRLIVTAELVSKRTS